VRDRFIAGLLVVVPIALVFWLIQLLYNLLNGPADSVIRFLISRHGLPDSQYFIDNTNGTIPGAGIMLTLLVIFSAGITVSHIVGRRFVEMIDRLFTSVPLIKTVYQSMQQVVQAVQQFSDKSKGQQFSQVVFVQMAGDGVYSMGFLTSRFTDPQGVIYATVFVPTPPSPINGLLFIVPVDKLVPADFISVEQATKMVITMGLVSPGSSK
jgi:uncharacterized membrane protein